MKKRITIKKTFTCFLCLVFLQLFSTVTAQTITLQPSDDAQVYEGAKTTNYGTKINVQVKTTDGSAVTRKTYLKFAITGLTLVQAGKATIRLYCNLKGTADTYQSVLGIFAAPNGWNENAITWNTAPLKGANLSSTIIAAKNKYYEWDVTDYLKSKIGAGDSISFALSDINTSNSLTDFATKEATANKPQLVIDATADVAPTTSAAYYLDSENGNDTNDGVTAATAWKTLNKLSTTTLTAGADVNFKSGQTFNGLFKFTNSGTTANPVLITTYGGTAPAVINGAGQAQAVFTYNTSNIEFNNLLVKNYRTTVNAKDYFNGILLKNENGGTLNHIHFDNVKIDSVNSTSDETTSGSVLHGGLQFNAEGVNIPSNWNNVLVENCTFSNLSRTGFDFTSDWADRNSNTNFGDPLGDGSFDN